MDRLEEIRAWLDRPNIGEPQQHMAQKYLQALMYLYDLLTIYDAAAALIEINEAVLAVVGETESEGHLAAWRAWCEAKDRTGA